MLACFLVGVLLGFAIVVVCSCVAVSGDDFCEWEDDDGR